MKDFNTYPHIVGKVAELLAEGDSVCVILGDREAVATTWDDSDIRAVAKKVDSTRNEDGSLGYLGWTAGATVDKPVVAGTLTVTARGASMEPYSAPLIRNSMIG